MDGSGIPVYLTGFHTWSNVINCGPSYPPSEFNWLEYLSALTSRGLNFTKLWVLESGKAWGRYRESPLYERNGPGNANDGQMKFDITKISDYHLDRLESRVLDCALAGIYVCVQLFQPWDGENKESDNGWINHPYNIENNINTVDGDLNGDDDAQEIYIYSSNPVLTYQQEWIEAVVIRLNQYRNVIYEVANEPTGSTGNTAWQEWVMTVIRNLESILPFQHLVGMTVPYPNGDNEVLDSSSADWVSYNNRSHPRDGTKANNGDTDHIEGLTSDFTHVFEEFVIGSTGSWYMDQWDGSGYGVDTRSNQTYELIRDNLGYLASLIEMINDLEGMIPQPSLCETGLCLAKDHVSLGEYVCFNINGLSSFDLNLSTASGTLNIYWIDCETGNTDTGSVSGGASRTLTNPFSNNICVAYVYH